MKNIKKTSLATAVAILFHVIGFVGIVFFNASYFIHTTPINLLLMFLLILYTQPNKNTSFYIFIAFCFILGIVVELIGTQTGILFGNYAYGNVLGPSLKSVPLIIGINWFIVIYCCGVSIETLFFRLSQKLKSNSGIDSSRFKVLSLIFDGACLAVFFDWLMEPVAIYLGYWKWVGEIPLFNYVCWFLVSMILLSLFHLLKFDKRNKFAVHLLLIQAMFFLLLRTFL
ncbi:MAG: carotenoid biosynthesis protein [Ferruginibacter sp.]|nr:carotenoid biosynthesis protein [Ferruginibacter sp.]